MATLARRFKRVPNTKPARRLFAKRKSAAPVGVFKMEDEKGLDEKILCVPIRDPLWNHIRKLSEVPPHILREVEHFFKIYKELENKVTKIEGWFPLKDAIKIIQKSKECYLENPTG